MMPGWIVLTCPCGSELFVQGVHMVWKKGAGATPSPVGMVCMKCGAHLDVGKMSHQQVLEEMRRQLKEMEDG